VKKVVIDTSLYIEWFRGQHLELAQEILVHQPFLSSVVTAELKAGARSAKQQRSLEQMLSCYEDSGRVITPTHQIYRDVGDVIAKLAIPAKQILGDALIAMSARWIGAEVWTKNEADFALICKARPFKLKIVR